MSDREFENYLTLLAGLLRLSGKQRDAIADELRSHLEDRLEELMAGGVSHDEAVKQALAEFGDAAGLAGQFVAISKNRKRRWLVRLVTFSAAATILIAASLITFWPGRNAAPGRAAAIAQQPETKEQPPAAPKAATAQSMTDRIEAELNNHTNVDLVDMPLKDVAVFLSDTHGIPIVLSKKKLEEASVTPDTPVTLTLRGVTLRSVLRLILKEQELTYVLRDEVLQITTPEDAESQLLIRVYDCRDLLAMAAPDVPKATPQRGPAAPSQDASTPAPSASPAGGGIAAAGSESETPASRGPSQGRVQRGPQTELDKRTDAIVELVTGTVKPDSWDDVGGPGAIDAYNGLFVVSQTSEVHEQVERLFDMLRQAAGLQVIPGAKVVR
jgi:hypothetical protein